MLGVIWSEFKSIYCSPELHGHDTHSTECVTAGSSEPGNHNEE